MFAIVSLSTNLLVQHLIEPSSSGKRFQSYWNILNVVPATTIPRLWAASHIFFASLLISTWWVNSSSLGIWVIGTAGVSWALTVWAPFAIIGSEIAELEEEDIEKTGDDMIQRKNTASIMGLHNAAISAPQILAALVSSLVFWAAHAVGSENGMQWVFALCTVTSVVAAYMARALDDE
jgi:solute carrier family 45 protein 1/2/4